MSEAIEAGRPWERELVSDTVGPTHRESVSEASEWERGRASEWERE
jgi:hypothetical protein